MSESYSGDHPSGEPAPDSEKQEITEEKRSWLDDLPPKRERVLEVEQLPSWVKTAVVRYELGFYDTLEEAANDFDRAQGTFSNWLATPGGRKWRETLRDIRDDPASMAEVQLAASLHEFTADFVAAFKSAVQAGDHKEVRKYWETINDRLPEGLSQSGDFDDAAQQIVINLPGAADPEPVEVEPVEVEEIEPADEDE